MSTGYTSYSENFVTVFPGYTYIFSFDKENNILFHRLYDIFDNIAADYIEDSVIAIAYKAEVRDDEGTELVNVFGYDRVMVVA